MTARFIRTDTRGSSSRPGERFSTKRPDTFTQTRCFAQLQTSCSQAADHTLSPVCKIRSRIWTKRAAVGHTLKPRLRLMRRRIRQRRVRRVQVLAAVWATALFLAEWAGWRSKLTWGAPRQLQDIWWHLPVLFGVFFALCMLWPWRLDSYDDI